MPACLQLLIPTTVADSLTNVHSYTAINLHVAKRQAIRHRFWCFTLTNAAYAAARNAKKNMQL